MLNNKLGSKQLLEEVLLRAHIELMTATREAVGSQPNVFRRDVAALHSNTTKADIPDYLRKSLADSSHAMLAYINTQGFVLVPKD